MKYFLGKKCGYIDCLIFGNDKKIKKTKSILIQSMSWKKLTKKQYDSKILLMKYPIGCNLGCGGGKWNVQFVKEWQETQSDTTFVLDVGIEH